MTGVAWRTSSYSGSNGGTCVEVGTAAPAVAVRDSKHPDGPLLAFAAATWTAFIEQLKSTALPRISPGSPSRSEQRGIPALSSPLPPALVMQSRLDLSCIPLMIQLQQPIQDLLPHHRPDRVANPLSRLVEPMI